MRLMKLITFFLLVATLGGCIKKGEEDPIISINKRIDRLKGEWTLSELQIQDFDKDATGVVNSVVRTLLKGKYTETRGTDTLAKTYIGTINGKLTITDATYTYTETIATNGLNYTRSIADKGWSWNDKTKKDGLVLSGFKSFDITGLWSDKLILTITDINDLNANANHSYVERWVFTK